MKKLVIIIIALVIIVLLFVLWRHNKPKPELGVCPPGYYYGYPGINNFNHKPLQKLCIKSGTIL